MLSRQEHQRLIDIEQHLRATDPDLARSLSAFPSTRRVRRQLAAAVVAVMALAVFAGLGVLILS